MEFFKENEGYRCGYCRRESSRFSHGMWGHLLTTRDYQVGGRSSTFRCEMILFCHINILYVIEFVRSSHGFFLFNVHIPYS